MVKDIIKYNGKEYQLSTVFLDKMALFDKLFGSYQSKELKKIEPIKDAVLALADKYKALSDDELKNQTNVLKARLAEGETLDDILPDAFAVFFASCCAL